MIPESAALATVPKLIKESSRDQVARDWKCMFPDLKLQRAAVVVMEMSGAAGNKGRRKHWKRRVSEKKHGDGRREREGKNGLVTRGKALGIKESSRESSACARMSLGKGESDEYFEIR